MNKALIIEDDLDVVKLLQEEILELGYVLEVSVDGQIGLEKALSNKYEFILLDLRLPNLSGLEVCKKIREQDSETPIIVISSKTDEVSTVVLLEVGADDYIAKPFRVEELKARIKAVLRRKVSSPTLSTQPTFVYGRLTVDFEKHRVLINETPVSLTPAEFSILKALVSCPGRPLTKDQLVEVLHGNSGFGYDNNIASHVNRLRNKLEAKPDKPELILTVRGAGYCFTDR